MPCEFLRNSGIARIYSKGFSSLSLAQSTRCARQVGSSAIRRAATSLMANRPAEERGKPRISCWMSGASHASFTTWLIRARDRHPSRARSAKSFTSRVRTISSNWSACASTCVRRGNLPVLGGGASLRSGRLAAARMAGRSRHWTSTVLLFCMVVIFSLRKAAKVLDPDGFEADGDVSTLTVVPDLLDQRANETLLFMRAHLLAQRVEPLKGQFEIPDVETLSLQLRELVADLRKTPVKRPDIVVEIGKSVDGRPRAVPLVSRESAIPEISSPSLRRSRSITAFSFSSVSELVRRCSPSCRSTSANTTGFVPMPRIWSTTARSRSGAETERVSQVFHPRWWALTQT